MKMITEETIKEWGEKNPEFQDYINNNLPEKDISELLAMKPSYESFFRIKDPILKKIAYDEWEKYIPIWAEEILQKELAKKKKLAKRGHSNEFIQIFIDYLSKKLEYQEEIKVQDMSFHKIKGIRNKYSNLQTFYNEVIETIAYELDRILFADSAGVIPFLKKNNICKEFRDILDIHRTYTKERLNIDKKKVQLDTWKLIQKRIGDATKIMNTKRMEKLA